MNDPRFAMLDVPAVGEARWGTRTLDELKREDKPAAAAPSANSVRVFVLAQSRDATTSEQAELARRGARALRSLLKEPGRPERSGWFWYDTNHRLRPTDPARLQREVKAEVAIAGDPARPPDQRPALLEVVIGLTETDPDAVLSQLQERITQVTRSNQPKGEPATREFLAASDPAAADVRAEFLQRGWPDSHEVGVRILGVAAASAASAAARARKDGVLVGAWAGRAHGGYVHPDFQFMGVQSDGMQDGIARFLARQPDPGWGPARLNPRIRELLLALEENPRLSAEEDPSGWARVFWLYQRRAELSQRSIALRQASLSTVAAEPTRVLELSGAARTPAEVFASDPHAVIELALHDAAEIRRAMEGPVNG